MRTTISDNGLQVLKSMVGQKMFSITADDWHQTCSSFGNIKIIMADQVIQLQNDYRIVPVCGEIEELSGFDVQSLQDEADFEASVMQENLRTDHIGKIVVGIEVVRDDICLIYPDREEHHIIDQAIIFKFDGMQWLVSQRTCFSPISEMRLAPSVEKYIYTVAEIKDEWSDDEDPRYDVQVTRSIIIF